MDLVPTVEVALILSLLVRITKWLDELAVLMHLHWGSLHAISMMMGFESSGSAASSLCTLVCIPLLSKTHDVLCSAGSMTL